MKTRADKRKIKHARRMQFGKPHYACCDLLNARLQTILNASTIKSWTIWTSYERWTWRQKLKLITWTTGDPQNQTKWGHSMIYLQQENLNRNLEFHSGNCICNYKRRRRRLRWWSVLEPVLCTDKSLECHWVQWTSILIHRL